MVSGQNEYKGTVVDTETYVTLPYINIGILIKGIGIVSAEKGVFYLQIDSNSYTQLNTL